MEYITSPFQAYDDYVKDFTITPAVLFTREHLEIPILAVTVYLIALFKLPEFLPRKYNVKKLFAAWNLLLCVFSIAGFSSLGVELIRGVINHGIYYTVCTPALDWYGLHGPGFWMTAFIFSKLPELLDTFFLVVQKKDVMFIHWFHHITVMLYCWHAFHTMSSPGVWFGAMNYAVHSIMYFYYFLTAIGKHHWARPMARTITTAQIMQMFMGTTVTILAGYWKETSVCDVDRANYKLGLAMYLSYLILFCMLFINKYSSKSSRATTSNSKREKQTICGVDYKTDDTAGMFHGSESEQKSGSESEQKSGSESE
jgi:elongation of very long chain fatty acids protein 6